MWSDLEFRRCISDDLTSSLRTVEGRNGDNLSEGPSLRDSMLCEGHFILDNMFWDDNFWLVISGHTMVASSEEKGKIGKDSIATSYDDWALVVESTSPSKHSIKDNIKLDYTILQFNLVNENIFSRI